jgi:hypothetical protein
MGVAAESDTVTVAAWLSGEVLVFTGIDQRRPDAFQASVVMLRASHAQQPAN